MATKTKFGLSQLTCKTPDFAHWIPQFYILFAASGMGMLSALGIPHDIQVNIGVIAIAFAPLFVLIAQCFGISLPEQNSPTPTEEAPNGNN